MADLLAQGIVSLKQAQVSRLVAVSGVAWLAYDYCLTFSLEVKHIWRREWSLPKLMFIFARYYALFHVCRIQHGLVTSNVSIQQSSHASVMDHSCAALERINGYGTQVLSYTTDGLLIMRLHSVYGRKWKVTSVLLVLYIVQAIIEAVVVGVSTTTASPVAAPRIIPPVQGCVYSNAPRYSLVAWIPSLVFASILFGMTLYKLYELRLEGIKISGIFTVFARDGAMFFAMIFAAELMSTLTAAVAPLPLFEVGGNLVIAVFSIATTRLILNLREYGHVSIQGRVTLLSIGQQETGVELHFRHPTAAREAAEQIVEGHEA